MIWAIQQVLQRSCREHQLQAQPRSLGNHDMPPRDLRCIHREAPLRSEHDPVTIFRSVASSQGPAIWSPGQYQWSQKNLSDISGHVRTQQCVKLCVHSGRIISISSFRYCNVEELDRYYRSRAISKRQIVALPCGLHFDAICMFKQDFFLLLTHLD